MISILRGLMASDGNTNRPFLSLLLLGIVDFCCILIGLEQVSVGKIASGTIWISVGVGSGLIGYYWQQMKARIIRRQAVVEQPSTSDEAQQVELNAQQEAKSHLTLRFSPSKIIGLISGIALLVGVGIYRHYQNVTKEHQAPQQATLSSKGPPTYTVAEPPGGWLASWGEPEPQSDGSLMIRSAVRTETLFPLREHLKIMLVYRLRDNRVDVMNDRDIAKSAIFTVNNSDPLVIDTPIEHSILEKGIPNRQGHFSVKMEVALIVLPASMGSEQINKLADVAKNGGDILAKGGFGVLGTQNRLRKSQK